MDNVRNNISKGLLKSLEAIQKHQAHKQEFLKRREKIIEDIEEARKIWRDTMAQLPKTEFQEF